MSFRNIIADQLKHNRPKLAESSVKTYTSILYNLHKSLNKKEDDIKDFNDSKEILDTLKNKPSKIRKTVLSALYILTNNEEFRKLMISDCGVVNNEYKTQKMDDKQKENWISTNEIQDKYNEMLAGIKDMFSKQKLASYSHIMNFLLLAVLGGVSGMAPRRSLDYSLMKIKNYDPKVDNYYKSGKFYFRRYKTSEKYGLQTLTIPKDLDTLIKKWIRLNPTDYLLFSSNKQPVSSSQINLMLNSIFDGKHISCDMLRHIYLTNIYKDVPALSQMEQTAEDIGHSVGQAMLYIKKE